MTQPAVTAKRRINLTVADDVVVAAREVGLNMSGIAEDALRRAVSEAKRQAWEREHAESIRQYNTTIEQHGLWSDGLRSV